MQFVIYNTSSKRVNSFDRSIDWLYTFWIIIPDLMEGIIKMLAYLLLNKYKSKIYSFRVLGLLEALINRPSWRRPDQLIN